MTTSLYVFFFFFTATPPTEIYTLSLHDALPIFEPIFLLRRKRKRISACPGFGRGQAGQVPMRSNVVVEEAKLGERAVKRVERIDREPIELRLERAEEALDPAVLPGTAGIGSLMPA